MGPWEDQGTVVEDTAKEKRSFWDWWRNNGDTAVDAAGDLICLISPNSPRCRPAYPPAGDPRYYAPRQDNTLLYVLIGLILIIGLLLILKR